MARDVKSGGGGGCALLVVLVAVVAGAGKLVEAVGETAAISIGVGSAGLIVCAVVATKRAAVRKRVAVRESLAQKY